METVTRNIVCVPIEASLYGELVLRKGRPDVDVTTWIERVLMDYLDRNQSDEWSPAYSTWLASTGDLDAFRKENGDPQLGYHWGTLFLPNGTKISMSYKGRIHVAEVRQ